MERERTEEHEYDFVLFLDGIADLTSEAEAALFEAGCDDATICVRFGQVNLNFLRTASSFLDATASAIRDVQKAKIGVNAFRIKVGNVNS